MHYLPDTTTNPIQQTADHRLNKIAKVVRVLETEAIRNQCLEAYELELLANLEQALDLSTHLSNNRTRLAEERRKQDTARTATAHDPENIGVFASFD